MIGGPNTYSSTEMRSILISGGSTNVLQTQLKEFINQLSKLNLKNIYKIYIDKQLHFSGLSSKFLVADYSDEMFNEIFLGIVRPGLGIISELLQRDKIIFSLNLENNFEILSNNNAIRKHNLGKVFNSVDSNLFNSIESINEESKPKRSSIGFNGVDQIFLKICDEFN